MQGIQQQSRQYRVNVQGIEQNRQQELIRLNQGRYNNSFTDESKRNNPANSNHTFKQIQIQPQVIQIQPQVQSEPPNEFVCSITQEMYDRSGDNNGWTYL